MGYSSWDHKSWTLMITDLDLQTKSPGLKKEKNKKIKIHNNNNVEIGVAGGNKD